MGSFVLLYSAILLSCISSICGLSTIVLGIVVYYMLYVYVYAGGRLEDPFYVMLCIWVYTLSYIGILLFCMFLVGIVICVCIVMRDVYSIVVVFICVCVYYIGVCTLTCIRIEMVRFVFMVLMKYRGRLVGDIY